MQPVSYLQPLPWIASALRWWAAVAIFMVTSACASLPGPALVRPCAEGECACAGAALRGDRHLSPLPPLTITYFGASTLMFDDGRSRILIDGYFSRPGAIRTLALPLESDSARIQASLGGDARNLRAILTAHAHHDHALDTVALARAAPGAAVIGTAAVAALAQAGGVDRDRLCVPADRSSFVFDAFSVTAVHAPHGPGVPFVSGLIDKPMRNPPAGPAHAVSFKDDRALSFLIVHGTRRILVHPSAGELDLRGLEADIAFVGIGRLGMARPQDAERYLLGFGAARTTVVVPIHWDAFTTRPGSALRPTPWPLDNVSLGFDYVCRHLSGGRRILRMETGSTLILQEGTEARLLGHGSTLCDSTARP